MTVPLTSELLRKMNAYWRAANYISAGQIYLKDNPLLESPLTIDHIKPRLLGHWGTTPGLNFLCVHLNRLIVEHGLNMIYVIGPGHVARACWQTPTSKAPTPSATLPSSVTGTVRAGCFASVPGPAARQVTSRRKRQAPSRKAAAPRSAAAYSPMPSREDEQIAGHTWALRSGASNAR